MVFLNARKLMWGLAALAVLLAGFALKPDRGNSLETGGGTRKELVEEYRDQLTFVREEIHKIREDLEWLSLRIKRMKTMNRFVPEKMHDSVEFKKGKIKSLNQLKEKYEKLLSQKDAGMDAGIPVSALHDRELAEKIRKSGLTDWLEVIPMDPYFRIETRLPILFSSASATVARQYHPFLNKFARLLKGYDVRVVVDGYADMDPINSKKYPSNFELGATRAANVARILMKGGVSPSYVKIGSTGQYRLNAKKTSERKAFERQVRIAVIFHGKTGSPGE